MKEINIDKIYKILEKELKKYTIPLSDEIHLKTKEPFSVLIATILSARTRDSLTLKVVEKLFKKIKNIKDLEKIDEKELQELIKPVNFYIHKTKYLKQMPEALKQFNNKIPTNIEDLIKLPGVGRKTANVFLAVAHKKPAIGVDTHVFKIVNRLGYVKTKTPEETEIKLKEKLPIKYWVNFNTYLVMLGQNICLPRNPKCEICPINQYCKKLIKKKN